GAAADRALREAREQIGRLAVEVGRPPEESAALKTPGHQLARLLKARLDTTPEFVRHDPKLRGVQPKPLIGCTEALLLGAATDDLLAAVPGHDASVQLTVQHLPHARNRPSTTATRGCDVLLVQRVGNPLEAEAGGVHLEKSPHDVGLVGV